MIFTFPAQHPMKIHFFLGACPGSASEGSFRAHTYPCARTLPETNAGVVNRFTEKDRDSD